MNFFFFFWFLFGVGGIREKGGGVKRVHGGDRAGGGRACRVANIRMISDEESCPKYDMTTCSHVVLQ